MKYWGWCLLSIIFWGVMGAPLVANELSVRWYGHAFVYLTTAMGIRVAIDPFDQESVRYEFPTRLPADVVLVSNEGTAHAAGQSLFGNPQIFRAATAIGVNRANGLYFKGVKTFKDSRRGALLGANTVFSFELDGIRFLHLGLLGHNLDQRQRGEIGTVDVVFLPVGSKSLSVEQWLQIVKDVEAKVVVPIQYLTPKTGAHDLRPLEEFLEKQKWPVKKNIGTGFTLTAEKLPKETTVYLVESP